MSAIPDYTDAEIANVQKLLAGHYGEAIEIHLADSEIPLGEDDAAVTTCPVLFWNARGCNFAILRQGQEVFSAQFFYTPDEQYATTQKLFNTLEDCVSTVLRTQADHQRHLDAVKQGEIDKDVH